MSVIDPSAAAAQREQRRGERRVRQQGNPAFLLASLLFAALLVAVGAASGIVGGAMFDSARMEALTHFFADHRSTWGDALLQPLPILGAVACTVIVWSLFTVVGRRYTGGATTPGLGQLSLWLIGFAGGFWWLSTRLTTIPDVGVAVDPVFEGDWAWGWWEWTVYSADTWLPAVFGVLAALSVIMGIRGRARRRSRRNALSDLLVSGRRATGTVTETIDTGGEAAVRYGGHIVVKFTDAQGTTRWFRTFSGFRREDVPALGASVIVLFDAQRPDDTQRLFWSPGDGRTPGQFTEHLLFD